MFRVSGLIGAVSLLGLTLMGCQLATSEPSGAETTAELAEQLVACAVPLVNTGNACDLGDGTVKFQVTLPSGQAYVELFARRDGIQNLATAITQNAVVNADGTTTYALTKTGYASNSTPSTLIEYRFYSYLPNAQGVFTPGPAEQVWYRFGESKVSLAPLKDASVIYNIMPLGYVMNQNFGSKQSVDVGEYQITSDALFGYALSAAPAGMVVTKAELVMAAFYIPGGPTIYNRLNQILASESWSESQVTWNTKPAYSFLREVSFTQGVTNRIDVTGEVAAAVSAGKSEVSFALQPSSAGTSTDNVFIDSKEKPGGVPALLNIEYGALRTYTVDLASDSNDGSCAAGSSGKCNLRAALKAAQSGGGHVRIQLAVDPTITAGEIALASTSATNITIVPASSQGTRKITGNGSSRFLSVDPNTSLTLTRVDVSKFKAPFDGGAIVNNGKLVLKTTTIRDNAVECTGTGALTSQAACFGGAIANRGELQISDGSRFERNSLTATSSTASFTNALAGGGAISSSGSVIINSPVAFVENTSSAVATSGFHPGRPSDASATSSGGAISSSGSLIIRATSNCSFTNNSANAVAQPFPPAVGRASSFGGAISASGNVEIAPGCVFNGNTAQTNPDIHVTSNG